MENDCTGQHRYFVATDAATLGLTTPNSATVMVFLVCTACGEGRKVEFEVGNATRVSIKK